MRVFVVSVVFVTLVLAQRPAAAFDTWWHAVETQQACKATGFSEDARLVMQIENYLTDMIAGVTSKVEPYPNVLGELYTTSAAKLLDEGYDYLHFDALWDIKQVSANWTRLEKNTLAAIKRYSQLPGGSSFRMIAMFTALAASMHAVQDFYSHSNWVNYWTIMGKTPVPLWFDTTATEREVLPIHTGAYPDGSFKGRENHADLNKDSTSRPLNAEAVEAATRASTDWIKRLMADDPSLPWDELKSYSIQNDQVLKKFLNSDANFLTTSSIVLGHFDGSKPVKWLFAANDSLGEKKLAAKVLLATIAEYAFWIAKDKNNSLPSPYWSSHFIYHVPRDIADGLMSAGKTYAMPPDVPTMSPAP